MLLGNEKRQTTGSTWISYQKKRQIRSYVYAYTHTHTHITYIWPNWVHIVLIMSVHTYPYTYTYVHTHTRVYSHHHHHFHNKTFLGPHIIFCRYTLLHYQACAKDLWIIITFFFLFKIHKRDSLFLFSYVPIKDTICIDNIRV